MEKLCIIIMAVTCSIYGQENSIPDTISKSYLQFDTQVFQELRKTHPEFVYSAFSLENILLVTVSGASGETSRQIKTALNLSISTEQLRRDAKSSWEQLKNSGDATFKSPQKLFVVDDFKIKPSFLKLAKDDFGCEVEKICCRRINASEIINSWVERQTDHKIKKIVCEKKLSVITHLVLVNAIYFQGNWQYPFDEKRTEKMDFHISKTEVVQVDMMTLTGNLLFQRNPSLDVTILQLRFANTNASFLIVLPNEIDGLEAVGKKQDQLEGQLNPCEEYVTVYLPRFKVESSFNMIPLLKKLGITNLFSNADLSGIAEEDLSVSSVLQKTFISINETGAEAASATAIVIDKMSSFKRQVPEVFKVDHPFIFGIFYKGFYVQSGQVVHPMY